MSEFHGLVEREIPRLRRYARALTRSADRADDLVQETLLRAITKEHLWQPGTNMQAWLFTIMHNQNVNAVRSAVREGMAVGIEELSSRLVATEDPTAARQLLELDRSLTQLPQEQRQVILLVGLEGMSYEEAADILNVPIGTIRSITCPRRAASSDGPDRSGRSGEHACAGMHGSRSLPALIQITLGPILFWFLEIPIPVIGRLRGIERSKSRHAERASLEHGRAAARLITSRR
jgi:RNA polymerase sigma-70 factor, ECF subfamily